MLRWLAALAVSVNSTAAMAAECRVDSVDLRGDWGQVRFRIEVADTPEERSRGLMFRDDLARMEGMLFVYETPRRASFWMKNTLIPLDMIFADRGGRVVHVHSNAIPGDLTAIDGGDNVFAVLEINGGMARMLGLGVGTQLRHKVFSGGPAAWPC